MATREDARLCERCGLKWFAERPSKAPKPRWYDDGATPWGSGSARMTRLQNNYQRSLAGQERWARCARCGSIKVSTVSDKGFVPTVMEGPGPSQHPGGAGSPNFAAPTSPGPDLASPAPAPPAPAPAQSEGGFKRFMKKHWRITFAIFCTLGVLVMPFGGETAGDKVGGTIMYLVGAIVFWYLHKRHMDAGRPTRVEGAPLAGGRDHLDTSVDDGWAHRVVSCREKAAIFNEVGSATTSEPVREWFSSMADDLDSQLLQVDDLAALGRSVEPGFTGDGEPSNPAAREAWTRLGQFEAGLDDAVTGAAQVRLNSLSPASSLQSIHGQLEMLRGQLPSLDVR